MAKGASTAQVFVDMARRRTSSGAPMRRHFWFGDITGEANGEANWAYVN